MVTNPSRDDRQQDINSVSSFCLQARSWHPVSAYNPRMTSEVRYCTTADGVRIAYSIEGEGPPLVACPHIFESFGLEHLFPDLQRMRREGQAGHRVVRYDSRGTGLSQRDTDDLSHEAFVRDLEAVVQASGVERFALVATGFSGAAGIDYTTRHPELVDRLVLWGVVPRFSDVMPEGGLLGFAEFARTNWQLAAQAIADAGPGTRSEMSTTEAVGFGELIRESMTGEMAAKIVVQQLHTSDVRSLLSQVAVPTLVVESEITIRRGQAVAAAIPDARLFVRAGGDTSFVYANSRGAIEAMRSFLGAVDATAPEESTVVSHPSAFRTILFTDIVGHSKMMQRLGDAKGRDVLRDPEGLARGGPRQP